MQRTKKSFEYPETYSLWGGHMPFPPRECTNYDHSFVDKRSGMRWLDNSFCSKELCGSMCQRRKDYMANDYYEYRKEIARLFGRKAVQEQE